MAAAAIVDDLERPRVLLAVRRHSPPALAGQWEFPGGKVEPGEEPPAAAVRECAEELGVSVRLGAEVTNPAGGPWPICSTLAMRVWWAQITTGRPHLGDTHDELRWLTRAQLHQVAWLSADVAVVARLAERFRLDREVAGG